MHLVDLLGIWTYVSKTHVFEANYPVSGLEGHCVTEDHLGGLNDAYYSFWEKLDTTDFPCTPRIFYSTCYSLTNLNYPNQSFTPLHSVTVIHLL